MKREITLIIISVLTIPILLYGVVTLLPEREGDLDDYRIELAGSDRGEYRIEGRAGMAWAE